MHRLGIAKSLVVLALVGASMLAGSAGWTWVGVGDGIEYQSFTVSGPNNVFVCRMKITNTNATIESSMANGKTSGGTQTVSAQGTWFDEAVAWWGQEWGARNDVVCAINGDFFSSGVMNCQQIHSGWYAKRMCEWGGDGGFGWTTNRFPFIGGCIHTTDDRNTITVYPEEVEIHFDDVGVPRGSNETILYTPQYDSDTNTDNSGTEFLIEMQRPTLILPKPYMALGPVKEVRQNLGSTHIPWDHIVISATGSEATNLLAYLHVGDQIGISQEFLEYEKDCNTPRPNYWTKTYASIGSSVVFLKNGVIIHNTQEGMIARNPRTCIAYNADYVFFVVCDGRSAQSVGWTNDEMATFCLNSLAATDGVNQDGGGSSTMVVNGVVMNVPSDGSPRAVANGMLLVNVLTKVQSTRFSTGETVTVNTNGTAVRLGPGTNYASITTVNSGATGTVVAHSLNGLYAKQYCWWKVNFSGTVGWVAETLIMSGGLAPVFLEHPDSHTACSGQTTKFYVAATGQGSLSYRWQKNSVSLSNGGHYSGVLTPKLIISSIDANDVANYRCRVVNTYGTTYSNEAALTLDTGATTPTIATPSAASSSGVTWRWNDVSGELGYRVKDTGGGVLSPDLPANTTEWTEGSLTPNALYSRVIYAFNSCGESSGSATESCYPMAKAGIDCNITCGNALVGTWKSGSSTFNFWNPVGFGTSVPDGNPWVASKHDYKWNLSSTESWASAGTAWSSGYLYMGPTSGEGWYYMHIRAFNANDVPNNTEIVNYGPFGFDVNPPSAVSVTDEGSYTPSQNTLKASWTAATDSASGLNRYEYAVGTSPTTQNIKGWTTNGTSTSVTISGLSLVDGTTYYVQVRAVDNVENTSGGSAANGILVAPGVSPIASAWSKANDIEPFSLRNKVVTAKIGNAFWLEETDRMAAIKVVSSDPTVARGNTVSVAGVLGLSGTQRALIGDVVVNSGGNTTTWPLGVNEKELMCGNWNGSTPGMTDGNGLYDIGLLVKCAGSVTYSNTTDPNDKYFYLDDGSGLSSDGHMGVKVSCGTVSPPSSGVRMVTGILSSDSIGGKVVPVLLIRDSNDIQTP